MNRFGSLGHAALEYLIGTALVVTIFYVGEPDLIQRLVDAFSRHFADFSRRISLP